MMFLNDVHKKEEIKSLALRDLRNLGIKFRLKKPRQHVQKTKSRKVFKVPLCSLPMQTVTLVSGQQLVVPKLLHEMCSYVLTKVDTEGLFRKGGSKSRQNEIKLSLDAGCHLGDEHHEVDVASVLKAFFRELPEPLFPVAYHDLFLHCVILPADHLRAILLVCLLLPCEHLNTLAYLMQFLHQVTQYAEHNKMDAYNLAVVMGPALLPVEEKLAPSATYRVNKFCEVFKLLIENASSIGFVPNDIIERIALSCSSTSLTDEDAAPTKKKKKRRSGSLTRMLNGLKKIVSSKSAEDTSQEIPTPDLLSTPCMTRSAKKRKFDGAGFSMRKKKDIITKLPQNSTLSTPFNPKTKEKEKKWLIKSKAKTKKVSEETTSISSRTSAGTKTMLERRWSQISHVADFCKNKKRNSCGGALTSDKKLYDIPSNIVATINMDENAELKSTPEPEYVKISRTEYEDIKNRVSEIERRISIELENTTTTMKGDTVKSVQTVYEQTLEHLEPLSPTTDQLAKRLSKELKIRRSGEQKIIRSPSARKIGSLRRRSRSSEKKKLIRTQTWHVSSLHESSLTNSRKPTQSLEIEIPLTSLNCEIPPSTPAELIVIPAKNSTTRYPSRSSSLHDNSSSISKPRRRLSDNWQTSGHFFESSDASSGFENGERCRASLVRLRNQNAGMVLAKARLFDDLIDSDSNPIKGTPNLIPRVQTNKLGAARNTERQSYRIRALKAEERRVKKNPSPRKRPAKSPNMARQRIQRMRNVQVSLMLEEGSMSNKENIVKDPYVLGNSVKVKGSPLRDSNLQAIKNSPCTPRVLPQIKRPFNVKSPKRLNKIQGLERTTPLKVIATIRREY